MLLSEPDATNVRLFRIRLTELAEGRVLGLGFWPPTPHNPALPEGAALFMQCFNYSPPSVDRIWLWGML